MKKLYFLITLFAALLSFSCGNPNTEPPAQQEEEMTPTEAEQIASEETIKNFQEGWYYALCRVDGGTYHAYIEFDSEKIIKRIGSKTEEYTGDVFESVKNYGFYSWENLVTLVKEKKATLKMITENDLPDFFRNTHEENTDNTTTENTKPIVKVKVILKIKNSGTGKFFDGTSKYELEGVPGENINICDIPGTKVEEKDNHSVYSADAMVIPNDGYEFMWWEPSFPRVFPNEDTTYTAVIQKKVITYSITYHLNGGSISYPNPTTYTDDEYAITLKTPSQEGYTFNGWTTDSEEDFFETKTRRGGGETDIFIVKGKGDIDLYAKWYPNEYYIIMGDIYAHVFYGQNICDFFKFEFVMDQGTGDRSFYRFTREKCDYKISEGYDGWILKTKILNRDGVKLSAKDYIYSSIQIPESEQFMLIDENGNLIKNVPNCTDENGNWIGKDDYKLSAHKKIE